MKPVMFCRNSKRNAALRAQFDEMRGLQRRFGKQDAVVGDDADRIAVDVGEAGHQRGAVVLLELVEFAAVDDARDDLAHVVGLARIGGNDAAQLLGRIQRLARLAQHGIHLLHAVEVADDGAGDRQGVRIVQRQMVGDSGLARVHLGAAEFLGCDDFAGGGFHQRRPAEENRALPLDDDGFVRHRRHIGAAGGARAHHHCDLRDAGGRHIGLVVENAAEVLAVREHLFPGGQVGAARIHQINAGQVVLRRDFLRAQMLFHRHREIGAAFYRGVVHHDHAFLAEDAADAGDDAGAGRLVVVHVEGGELRQFEKRRARIEQGAHALARQQLAAGDMLGARSLAAACRDLVDLGAQIIDQGRHRPGIDPEFGGARVEVGLQCVHGGRQQEWDRRW